MAAEELAVPLATLDRRLGRPGGPTCTFFVGGEQGVLTPAEGAGTVRER